MLDTGDNPDAPAPREMIDLEVCILKHTYNTFYAFSSMSIFLFKKNRYFKIVCIPKVRYFKSLQITTFAILCPLLDYAFELHVLDI